MKKLFALGFGLMLACSSVIADDYMSVSAIWHHNLASTVLKGYKTGEHFIISSIMKGEPGVNAESRNMVELKVTAWGKPFTETIESPDQTEKDVFTVTLFETSDPKEMKADFDHTVYKDKKIFLRFRGTTMLVRVN